MALWLVVLVAVLFWLGASTRTNRARPDSRSARGGGGLGVGWWLALAIVGVLLIRFGLHWVAVAGGAALAVARSVLPLVRLLPFLQGVREATRRSGEASSHAAGDAHGEARSPSGRRGRMTREEALQVLGLSSSATADDVRREYRRLMKKMHPDLGGSSYLAAKINEARDVLS